MKVSHFISLLPAILAVVSCTGDPRSGGIFWSESKAQERIAALQVQESAKQSELEAKQQTTAALNRQKCALQKEIEQLKVKMAGAEEAAEIEQLKAEIRTLEAQINALSY